ncbi:MAG: alpha/beta hydrolase family protein, partial [Minisyncoccota bacterium]
AEAIEAVDFEYLANGKKYNGFYARPKHLSKQEKHPIVILNRGGSDLFGHIDAKHIFSGFATSVIKAGYIVIGSQCMGFAEDGAQDEMGGEDFHSVLALKEFIDADDRGDAKRIGLYCASRGATATFQLLAETDWAKAAVVISGALDYLDDAFRPEMTAHYAKVFGGSEEERKKRSVLSWPEKLPNNVPILLMNGTADWRVDPRSVLRFSEKLLDLKVPHRLVMFEGDDHMLTGHWQESRAMATLWFDRFVRNGEALPDMELHGE